MKKNNIVRSVCVILAVIMITGSVTAAKKKNGCDECDPKYKGPTYLELKVETINRKIMLDCCVSENIITHDQMTVAVHMFKSDIQKEYSKELICEQDGKKYYYPNFILDTSQINDDYNDETRYIIHPLDEDENGVYKGIEVTYYKAPEPPVPTEYELKRDEMNKRMESFEGKFLTKEEMENRVAKYKSFQNKYSNSYLCTDEDGTEHYCPEYELSLYSGKEPYPDTPNTRYEIGVIGVLEDDYVVLDYLYVRQIELDPSDPNCCALMQK